MTSAGAERKDLLQDVLYCPVCQKAHSVKQVAQHIRDEHWGVVSDDHEEQHEMLNEWIDRQDYKVMRRCKECRLPFVMQGVTAHQRTCKGVDRSGRGPRRRNPQAVADAGPPPSNFVRQAEAPARGRARRPAAGAEEDGATAGRVGRSRGVDDVAQI
jgi:hypothetical protein